MKLLVNIDVDDLERGIDFYTRAFDFVVSRRFGNDAVELAGADAAVYLLAKPVGSLAAPTAIRERDYQRHWTPVHLDLVVDDIDTAVRRAVDAGAMLEQPATARAYGSIALLADPFGHGLCLLQFNDQGYDALCDPGEDDEHGVP